MEVKKQFVLSGQDTLGLDRKEYCLNFAVISDPHINSSDCRHDVRMAADSIDIFRDTIKRVKDAGAELVVLCGDVLEARDFGFPNLELAHREISQIPVPWLVLMGNHDARYHCTQDAYRKEDFAQKFKGHGPEGKHCYWRRDLEGKKITFIGLDTSQVGTSEGIIEPEQKEWLEDNLSEIAPDRAVFIFMHHPAVIFDSILEKNEDLNMYYIDNHCQMRALFKKYKTVKAVICGHNHVRRHEFIDGIHYICVPSINTWPNMYTEFALDAEKIAFKHIPIYNKSMITQARRKIFCDTSPWLRSFYGDKEALAAYFNKGAAQGILPIQV